VGSGGVVGGGGAVGGGGWVGSGGVVGDGGLVVGGGLVGAGGLVGTVVFAGPRVLVGCGPPPLWRAVAVEVGEAGSDVLVGKTLRVGVKVARNVGINSGVFSGEILSKAFFVPKVANIAAVAGAPGGNVLSGSIIPPGIFVAVGVESLARELLKTKAAPAPKMISKNSAATPIRRRGILLFLDGAATGAGAGAGVFGAAAATFTAPVAVADATTGAAIGKTGALFVGTWIKIKVILSLPPARLALSTSSWAAAGRSKKCLCIDS